MQVFLDSEIHWWEAGLALVLYGAYVAFMAFQDTAARKVPIFRLCVSAARLHGAGDAEDGEGKPAMPIRGPVAVQRGTIPHAPCLCLRWSMEDEFALRLR